MQRSIYKGGVSSLFFSTKYWPSHLLTTLSFTKLAIEFLHCLLTKLNAVNWFLLLSLSLRAKVPNLFFLSSLLMYALFSSYKPLGDFQHISYDFNTKKASVLQIVTHN